MVVVVLCSGGEDVRERERERESWKRKDEREREREREREKRGSNEKEIIIRADLRLGLLSLLTTYH